MASATTDILERVRRAAIGAVAYGDVFGYPLDAGEVHRYLHGVSASSAVTTSALERAVGGPLSYRDGCYTLHGREELVAQRHSRADHARKLWPVAIRYGRLIATLPFVKMVAVTGSLAWNNVEPGGDIDYLVVTEPDRLWSCHWMIAVLTETVRRAGVPLCPNYLISERALELHDRNLYTAYELAQMKPIAGYATYRRMRELNRWSDDFLPNTAPLQPVVDAASIPFAGVSRLVEHALRTKIGAKLEQFEMHYRIRKWTRIGAESSETEYGVDCCKAHTSAHKTKILAALAERIRGLE